MNQPSRFLNPALMVLVALAAILAPLVLLYLQPAAGFQDPSSARVVVLHVPMAWLAVLGFIVSSVYAGRYLKRRRLEEDDASAAASEIGLLCSLLATATGSIFAHTQWGSWWNWDPRETSIFFLILIYGAYFSLRGSVEDPVRRAIFSAAYALLSCPVMLFLIFVMPRIIPSLHPAEAHLAGSYWLVLLTCFFGFLAFLTMAFRARCAIGRLALAESEREDADGEKSLRPTIVKRAGGDE